MSNNKNNKFYQYIKGNENDNYNHDSEGRLIDYGNESSESANSNNEPETPFDYMGESDSSAYSKNYNKSDYEVGAKGDSANGFLLKFILRFVYVVAVLAAIWYFCGYADGTYWYRKHPKECNAWTAIDLFQKGRYIDSSECFHNFYASSPTQMEKEFSIVAHRMSFYTSYKNGFKKSLRIYFKLPTAFNISEKERKGYGLADFIKSDIYDMVTHEFREDGSGHESVYDPREIACICYKMCGDYKDSKERYQRILKIRIEEAINKRDFKSVNKLINEISDKKIAYELTAKLNEAKYKTANEMLTQGELNSARKEFKKLANSGISDSKELFEKVNFNLMCMLGIHTNGESVKSKSHLYSSTAKELANKRNEAVEYFLREHDIKKEFGKDGDVVTFCREKLNELADSAYEKEDYQSAYENYTRALKCSPYNPKVLECAQKLSDLPRKVGSVVLLGHFEQDGITENGPEPIEWIVTAISDDKALLLSKYVLAAKTMNSVRGEKQEWKTSELRNWLNDDFYKEAFDEREKEELLKIEISLKDNRNRSIHGMGQFENPFLHKLLGDRDYKASEGIFDYVICPDLNDLKMLDERLELVAYATPAINEPRNYQSFLKYYPKNSFNVDSGSHSMRGLFASMFIEKEKKEEALSEKVPSEIASDSQRVIQKEKVKCFGPCGYWLRNWSQSSRSGTYFRVINEYGFEETEPATNRRIGVRPEIMIKLSASEAVKREKNGIEKTEDSYNRLIQLKKLEIELRKKGFIGQPRERRY